MESKMELYRTEEEYPPALVAKGGLLYFLQNAKIKVYSGDTPLDLMDLFPLIKRGFTNKRTLINLFNIYTRFNGLLLQDDFNFIGISIFDDLMNQAFAEDIPIIYHVIDYGNNVIKMPLQDAIQQGFINPPYNTIESIRSRFNGVLPEISDIIETGILFDPDTIDISGIPEYANNQDLIERIIDEDIFMSIILDAMLQLTYINEYEEDKSKHTTWGKVDIYSVIKIILEEQTNEDISIALDRITNNLVNIDLLCVAIITNNLNMVEYYSTRFDPRDNNYKAYFLAIENGAQEIIDLVKDNIIQRNFLEQEVFRTQIEQQTGISNLPRSIYNHTKTL